MNLIDKTAEGQTPLPSASLYHGLRDHGALRQRDDGQRGGLLQRRRRQRQRWGQRQRRRRRQ